MKYTVLIAAVIIAACSAQKTAQKSSVPKIRTEDSLQYELIVLTQNLKAGIF